MVAASAESAFQFEQIKGVVGPPEIASGSRTGANEYYGISMTTTSKWYDPTYPATRNLWLVGFLALTPLLLSLSYESYTIVSAGANNTIHIQEYTALDFRSESVIPSAQSGNVSGFYVDIYNLVASILAIFVNLSIWNKAHPSVQGSARLYGMVLMAPVAYNLYSGVEIF